MAIPHRLAILEILAEGEKTVGEITEEAGLIQTVTSQQLKILHDHDIVARRRDGNRVFYRINRPEVRRVLACLQKAMAR
ncbi:MAG: ArsR/SmtB family transcription factor [Rhodanobacteraceae bacterium]